MNNFWIKYHDSFSTEYQAAPDTVKLYIDSEQIMKAVDALYVQYVLPPDLRKNFSNAYIYLALGSIQDGEIVNLLVELGVDPDTAKLCIAQIVSDVRTATLPEELVTSTPLPQSSIEEDLAEIEKSLHQINPVRTMASDGKQIGYSSTTEDTYTSTQSAIINESK
ncbi:MAG: hypothetical protein UW75_C0003G0012 [Parcubacteria group bacterium GW2011_GWF2_44_8]|nr:MAG: hypothetical protein UW75_C0003G0012 [Parcubacteria group bacterium GW2011_GWF2_44_8]